MILLFANNAVSTLATPISNSSTSLTVASGQGSLFPAPSSGVSYFKITLSDAATGLVNEIVNCTARSGDVCTIVRGQEGTSAAAWSAGDNVQNLPTRDTMNALTQTQQLQADAPNYAVDTGTTNSYAATLSPAVSGRIAGLRVSVLAASSNTGASTLNIGAGSISITNPDGSALGTGAIVNGGVFTVVDTSSGAYQLVSASQQALSNAGVATTGDFKFRPTNESITGWVVANATTIGNASSNATQLANASAANLFAWHWNNFSNTQCPVFTSAGAPTTRGANAAADFAANKSIQVYDKRGKADVGIDTMGGAASTNLTGVPVVSGSTTTPGSVFGANLQALIIANLPVFTPAGTIANGAITITQNANVFSSVAVFVQASQAVPFSGGATITASQATSTFTGTSVGSGTAHNNVGLSDGMTYWIKL